MFRVFHLLQIAHSALFRAADQRSRRNTGLTITQLAVLHLLDRSDGQPISDIAAALAMGKSSLTGLVERLCDKGLVRRSPSPTDGRVTLIHIEPSGRDAAEQVRADTKRINQALLDPFAPQEQEVISRFLHHLERNADQIINGKDTSHERDD